MKKTECRWCQQTFKARFKGQALCTGRCLKISRRQRHTGLRKRARELRSFAKKEPNYWGKYKEHGWITRWVNHSCDRQRCDDITPNLKGRQW